MSICPQWKTVNKRFLGSDIVNQILNDEGLDLLFRNARTHSAWLPQPVDDALLQKVYDLAKFGPTSANMCPMRIVFVKSKESKDRLKPCLDAGNVDKTMSAPVTAIIGMGATSVLCGL